MLSESYLYASEYIVNCTKKMGILFLTTELFVADNVVNLFK